MKEVLAPYISSIPEIIAEIQQKKMVIIVDDPDRENEGDLIMAAECIEAEHINFMTRYGRGLVCLPLPRERCEYLELPLMVNNNQSLYHTNFTVSIEAAQGVTTGISCTERAHTIRTAVASDAKPSDLVRPGHVFPIMAADGGVLERPGHTEASCELARLAGFKPAGTLVEILNEEGDMARGLELVEFAKRHQLKIGTINDLIEYIKTR
ncbi:MAG: 3,4-dihydroxy-2-butanone-4-phosphate synthase [Gammaproteobacteria bacterium]